MSHDELWNLGFETIKELETERGILASSREEIYGCIFGRDSLITSLKLIRAFEKTHNPYLLSLVRKVLLNLAALQGQEINIESGEEPGKIIHEYRESNHEHLTQKENTPWYTYPDKTMKNYDSVDSTPLFLIAVSRYYRASSDDQFLNEIKPAVEKALGWMLSNIKSDEKGFVSYRFSPDRKYGGLVTQSWMDSFDSIFHEDGSPTPYPIKPVEVQAYTYLAMRLWELNVEADKLKERFNKHFVFDDDGKFMIAFALDRDGKPMKSLRSSIGHILWASNGGDTILDKEHIKKLVDLLLCPDLFEPMAGIRTLSKSSSKFDPQSYHNGSIWPHDTAMIAEGFENLNFLKEAQAVGEALRHSWQFFKTPLELFVYSDNTHKEYLSSSGQRACTKQAWSAASMLSEL